MLDAVTQTIRNRTSVRRFRAEPVPPELIRQIVDAGRWAPNAGNLQPWHFYVVTAADRRAGLARSAFQQAFIAAAPVCIVVCAEPIRSASVYRERGRDLYCIQDTAAAIQNILLTAAAAGLGGCWVGAFDEGQVVACLDIPAERRPVALIPLGYPDREEVRRTRRRDLDEVVTFV